ncbi:malto-oligosyltrehalose synthase [Mucilaginibacter auburnensis]|nr:malto-oligosyltrehalose synthase [Mucilaginibacter auburnensis]
MFDPVSTYRIQFHKDFTFKQLNEIVPYLQGLGIKTLYASPIFEATPGSTHGYDVTDPLNINPEIGTLDELREISTQLKQSGISWLQDIVPNHMAYHPNNKWLMDVLENGKDSKYASYFDIGWDSDVYSGRIMVPFLGIPFEEAIKQKQIQLIKKDGRFWFDYYGQQYPVQVDEAEKTTSAEIEAINNNPEQLKKLSDKQAYQLCHWQETDKQINFRRFFTVNGLICLNIQNQEVFDHYHQLIKQLLNEGVFQGLRVDHIDGLYDPEGYLQQLRELAGAETYITVEKILEAGEPFPKIWPVQGNTGYDFLAIVNNVFTNAQNEQAFTDYYQKLTGTKTDIEQSTLEKKAFILQQHMAGELENLFQLYKSLELPIDPKVSDEQLKEAIAQLLIHCPVYRYYGNAMPLSDDESSAISDLITSAAQAHPELGGAFNLLRTAMLDRTNKGDADYNGRALRFYQRCMQFTGPIMAKGVEDTLMYNYNRFIGHNEVGDSPAAFGLSSEEFHQLMLERQHYWSLSLNGTSTHDTKRGEDVRARLNALTDMPEEWLKLVKQWRKESAKLKTNNAPDGNDEYFIYQTILGAHPMPQSGDDNFAQRLQDYLIKALREGKQNSDWATPNEAYEDAVKSFIAKLLNKKSSFTKSFKNFHQRVADYGIINSLAQVLLKFTCPGIPDIYQGCELWDLSMVDPDNRRQVDYQLRDQYLAKIDDTGNNWKQLWQNRYNGEIKITLTRQLLNIRNEGSKVFTDGNYLPLATTGRYKDNILAFARQLGKSWYVTIVPLHLAAIGADGTDPCAIDWRDTAVTLPNAAPGTWTNILTGDHGYTSENLSVSKLLCALPVALLKLEKPTDRGAGLLLHVTSLPSAFGVGDIGPQAHQFIDFLYNSGQQYWQMLPVNPVDKGAGYSPYSATSSIAGNTLLISPELMVTDGWLGKSDIEGINLPSTSRADLYSAMEIKTALFDKAWRKFIEAAPSKKKDFEAFKLKEDWWLDDFALYQVSKQNNKDKPWYEWPKPIRNREVSALEKTKKQNATAIEKEKWLQYLFSQQWQSLKNYADKKGVVLFGDMPFYISYDSVDVWSNPELFKLDKEGRIQGVAGVPPDYFSAEGQLWGMPVYHWDILKEQKYKWWLQRIRKNLEYFDLIRLDHFRAFSDYWEVPGGETTAITGKWQPGPGVDFFKVIKNELGDLPFVAEDLGEIDEPVYQLRDEFGLPGMRVLQFAFGGETPVSDHIPHNFTQNSFAYTGTHDNNTLKGWFMQDADAVAKTAIREYTGQKITEKNICDVLIRQCFASVAKVAILPVQDVLELDGASRMNVPSSASGNWGWQLNGDELNKTVSTRLLKLTKNFNR